MTDNTQPDSGRIIITSSDILLHDAKTALMYEELRSAIDDGHESTTHADALAEIAAIRAENVELRTGYAAARLEIESLQATIEIMVEEHADELMQSELAAQHRRAKAMETKVTFRWEQDDAGGEHGMATYFVGTPNEVSLRIDTLAEAHKLDRAIGHAMSQQRRYARAGLLASIGRIQP